MKITKQMRIDLANQLTVKAVAKNAPAMCNEAKRINQLFWDSVDTRLGLIEGIPDAKHWPGLIQAGLMTATISGIICKGGSEDWLGLLDVPRAGSYGDVSAQQREQFIGLRAMILMGPEWAPVSRHVTRGNYSWGFNAVAPRSYPRLAKMYCLEQGCDLRKDIVKFGGRLAEIFVAAQRFHDECLGLLAGISTAKKLEDIFPEAAALLPPPPVDRKMPVPQEAADKLRGALALGVPE